MAIRTFALACFLLTCAASIGVAGGLGELDVPLNIQEWAGVDRRGDVVSTGVPMPYGVLTDADLAKIAVFAPDGRTIPAQFKVLERWREFGQDGKSVKWLLVTFLVDLQAAQKATYHLKAGANPAPSEPARPFDGESVTLKLTLPNDKVISQDLGEMKPAGMWEEGPIRACVKWETPSTRDGDGFGCIVWAYTYAGLQRVDLTVVLKNTPNDPLGPLMFRDFSVEYKTSSIGAANDFLLGGMWGEPISGTVADTAYLYQSSDGTDSWDTQSSRSIHWQTGQWQATRPWANAYTLSYASYVENGQQMKFAPLGKPEFRGFQAFYGSKQIAAGNFAQGYAALQGKQASELMLVRDFLLQYPKAVEVRPGSLVARLWPKYYEAHNGLHWLDDLQRKAHDLSFQCVDGKLSPEAAEAAARAFDHPLVIHCGTDWYRKTAVYGYTSPRFSEEDIEVEPALISDGSSWVTYGGDLLDRIRRRYHQAPMGPFVRHGQPADANHVRVAMRHSTCVTPMWPDDYRYPRDAEMLKIGYCSPARKPGTYVPGTTHHGYMPWNNQHWKCAEIPDAWRLFGDPLAYDALQDMATYIRFYFDRRNSGQESINETRVDALPIVVMSHAYRILGDEALLEALREFVHTTCWREVNKQRGYYHPNKTVDPKAGAIDKPFMISTLQDGLREYWNLSNDETAWDLMLGMTDFCIDEAFLNDRLGFRYTIPADLQASRKTLAEERAKAETAELGGYRAWQMFRPLAWAYLHTGDEQYHDVFVKMCRAAKNATIWRHPGSPGPDDSDWGYLCDQVRDLPDAAKPDSVPPVPITDLRAKALGDGKVQLTWTTPAETARLWIKYADKPMVHRLNLPEQARTHANWWAAENVTGEPSPEPGKTQTMIVDGIAAGTKAFAIRAFDAAGNRSAIGNNVSVDVP